MQRLNLPRKFCVPSLGCAETHTPPMLMMFMRGTMLNLELIIAITAFSGFITVYFANVYTMQTQETTALASYAGFLNESATVQSTVSALDLRNISLTTLNPLLNSSIKRDTALLPLFPLNSTSPCAGCMTRILVDNGNAYYLQVYYNETSNQH